MTSAPTRPNLTEFRPYAMFDDRLDCIRVFTRDCSVKEIRINERITLFEDNFPTGEYKYVGFAIKGAKHLCKECGFDLSIPVRITAILDVLVASAPGIIRAVIDGIARPMVSNTEGI